VSLVKLDNFPFFSTKSRKNQLLQKKFTIFSIDQCSPFSLKFDFFSSQASSHRLILIFRMKKKLKKKIMSGCLLLLVPLCGVNIHFIAFLLHFYAQFRKFRKILGWGSDCMVIHMYGLVPTYCIKKKRHFWLYYNRGNDARNNSNLSCYSRFNLV
jgi:hypothetical protein